MSKIVYCQMTQNRLVETKECIRRYLPYVDEMVIVDGGSCDDSIFYLRNLASIEPKLKFYVYPWPDNFSQQRNNYLKHVPDNAWCLVSDPDEWFTDDLLQNLRPLVEYTDKVGKHDVIQFRCRSVTLKGDTRVWENLDDYHKPLLFKKYPKTRYVGNPHESLSNHPMQLYNSKYIYEHVKQENVIWHRGARNLFTGGGGPNLGANNKRWMDLRSMCDALKIETWHQFDAYLIKGNIDQGIKDWMIKYHDIAGFDGASEHREVYKLYFRIYHPEEEPEALRGKHIE